MATQLLPYSEIWGDELGPVVDFLSQFGIAPRQPHEYIEEDVLKAIRARGWEVRFWEEGDPPIWIAEITEWRALTQSQSAFGQDSDKMMALFRALRLALTWPTREEEAQAFDELVRSTLNMSATEFLERWRSDELDLDDPRVIHLLVARPLGW
jgi:hypothetical protein